MITPCINTHARIPGPSRMVLVGAYDYTVSVEVGVPEFARSMSDSDKWMTPIQADFTVTIDDAGLVTATEGHTTP